jgi:hypothetical protein
VAQVVQCLLCKYKALTSKPQSHQKKKKRKEMFKWCWFDKRASGIYGLSKTGSHFLGQFSNIEPYKIIYTFLIKVN